MSNTIRFSRLVWLAVLVPAVAFPAGVALKNAKVTPWSAGKEGGRVSPRYENGFILAYAPVSGDITVFDSGGAPIRTARVRLAEAALDRVDGVAISSTGQLVASVLAYSSDGKLAEGVAWMDGAGNVEKFVRTTPFAPRELSFAPDGTLWVLGDVYDTTFTNQPVPPYDLLWRFDARGARMQTALPSTLFKSEGQVAVDAKLAVSSDRIGVLYEPRNEWVEVSPSGEITGRWTLPAPPRTFVLRVALSSSGDVLMEQSEHGENKTSVDRSYLFEKKSGKFSLIDVSATGAPMPLFMGTDGERLAWRAPKGTEVNIVWAGLEH